MSSLFVNGDDVLTHICSFAIQSATDFVNQALTCKAFNGVLQRNIALCAGINFNVDRIAAEHRKPAMYMHITLRTPISLETFATKSVTFMAENHNQRWCYRVPCTTTTVVVKGFTTAFESIMIAMAINGTAIKT
jgi:hypothetical protein